jgi:3-hydroxyisobutyrate dehydrogenase
MSARVAFLGTGTMGAPMARNLARHGHDVVAWNRTPEKARALVDDGVATADRPQDAVDGCDVVITMLADGRAVEDVMSQSAVVDALPASAVWLQMSTVGVPAGERLGQLAATHAISYVAAPVVGSLGPAIEGTLVVLASGDAALRARCDDVLAAMSSRTLWLDTAGASDKLKVVVNAWFMALVAAVGEVVALAEHLGVPATDFLDATDDCGVAAIYSSFCARAMAAREFSVQFPLKLAAKDAGLALESTGDLQLPVLRATHEQFTRAEERGHGNQDWSAVIFGALPG